MQRKKYLRYLIKKKNPGGTWYVKNIIKKTQTNKTFLYVNYV